MRSTLAVGLINTLLFNLSRKQERVRTALVPPVVAVIDAIVGRRPTDARNAVRALTLQILDYLRQAAPINGEK